MKPTRPASAGFRGGERVYPASVIKMFYLVAAHRWLEDGRLTDTAELRRALRDMIVDSGNEATGYIVDRLTDTTSGPELTPAELDTWHEKRNAVNRYFAGLGFQNINVNRKTWHGRTHGREQQSVQVSQPNHRNWLTTDATARLLAEIVTGKAVTPERSRQMLALHERHPFDPAAGSQARGIHRCGVAPGSEALVQSRLDQRDATRCRFRRTAHGRALRAGHVHGWPREEKGIIPAIARAVIEGLRGMK